MRTRYIATVEVEAESIGQVPHLHEALAEFKPSLCQVGPGLWQVTMVVPADGLAAACVSATSVAQAATGAPAVSATVVSEFQHRARHEQSARADQVASPATLRSAAHATRGQADLNGVLTGVFELRGPSD